MKQGLPPEDYLTAFATTQSRSPRLWHSDYILRASLFRVVRDFAVAQTTASSAVLDVGCGSKPYRTLFPEACSYIGVDARGNSAADEFWDEEFRTRLPSGTFDVALCTQVIDLIPDFGPCLREMHRLLRPAGRALVSVSCVWTYHPASGGDYHRFTKDGLGIALERAGFEVVTTMPVVGTLAAGLHLRQLVVSSGLRRSHLLWIEALANVYFNVRMLLEDAFTPPGARAAAPVLIVALAAKG